MQDVLIIDDNDLMLKRMEKAIREIDGRIRISLAHNCIEAINLFTPSHPELVILDLSLPDGGGINLLKAFKKDDPGVQVIIFTDYPSNEFKESCLKLGADEFIDKKNYKQLLDIIK